MSMGAGARRATTNKISRETKAVPRTIMLRARSAKAALSGGVADGFGVVRGGAVEVAGQKLRRDVVRLLVPVGTVAEEHREGDLGALGGGEADEPGVRDEGL